mmetsp:Transcript_72224/g.211983  ORF Transcript_72224/g.211983 Transcript_72224/m.211983 type:complete len:240 (-) Transcript_72224:481-1200(-)
MERLSKPASMSGVSASRLSVPMRLIATSLILSLIISGSISGSAGPEVDAAASTSAVVGSGRMPLLPRTAFFAFLTSSWPSVSSQDSANSSAWSTASWALPTAASTRWVYADSTSATTSPSLSPSLLHRASPSRMLWWASAGRLIAMWYIAAENLLGITRLLSEAFWLTSSALSQAFAVSAASSAGGSSPRFRGAWSRSIDTWIEATVVRIAARWARSSCSCRRPSARLAALSPAPRFWR